MKKPLLFLLLSTAAILKIHALPIGNPAEPLVLTQGLFCSCDSSCCNPCDHYELKDGSEFRWDNYSLRAGYYGDFVYHRNFKIRDTQLPGIEQTHVRTNAGIVVINLWSRIDIFGSFGATKLDFQAKADSFGIPGEYSLDFETTSNFSWSIGIKGVLWQSRHTVIGIEGQFFGTNPSVHHVSFQGLATEYPKDSLKIKHYEWQFGLGISHRVHMFIPYIALKWSRADFTFDGPPGLIVADAPDVSPRFQNKNSIGMGAGVTLVDCGVIDFNIEARFIDEKALTINAQIRL